MIPLSTDTNGDFLNNSLPETTTAYPFDFNNISNANVFKLSEATFGEKDLIIPNFVDTLKPVIFNS